MTPGVVPAGRGLRSAAGGSGKKLMVLQWLQGIEEEELPLASGSGDGEGRIGWEHVRSGGFQDMIGRSCPVAASASAAITLAENSREEEFIGELSTPSISGGRSGAKGGRISGEGSDDLQGTPGEALLRAPAGETLEGISVGSVGSFSSFPPSLRASASLT